MEFLYPSFLSFHASHTNVIDLVSDIKSKIDGEIWGKKNVIEFYFRLVVYYEATTIGDA